MSFGRFEMEKTATTNAESVAVILHEEEARRVAVSAGRSAHASMWIAFGMLMVTLLGIGAGALVGYTQLNDSVKANVADTSDIKGQVRSMSATVNQIAGLLKINHQLPEGIAHISDGKDSEWEKSEFASSTGTPFPLCLSGGEPARRDSASATFLHTWELSPASGQPISKPSPVEYDPLTLYRLPPSDLSGSMFLTRVRW